MYTQTNTHVRTRVAHIRADVLLKDGTVMNSSQAVSQHGSYASVLPASY